MLSIRDIQFFLFCAYAVGYPVAVVAPVLIDPLLQTHAQFGPRQHPLAPWCIPIYILLLIAVGILFKKTPRISWLYWSILIAAAAFAISLPFFLPEFPHGNLFAVGSITLFLCALSVFVWSVCHRIAADTELLAPPGN